MHKCLVFCDRKWDMCLMSVYKYKDDDMIQLHTPNQNNSHHSGSRSRSRSGFCYIDPKHSLKRQTLFALSQRKSKLNAQLISKSLPKFPFFRLFPINRFLWYASLNFGTCNSSMNNSRKRWDRKGYRTFISSPFPSPRKKNQKPQYRYFLNI